MPISSIVSDDIAIAGVLRLPKQAQDTAGYYLMPYFLQAALTLPAQRSATLASPAATTVLTVAALIRIGVRAMNGVPSGAFLETVGWKRPGQR